MVKVPPLQRPPSPGKVGQTPEAKPKKDLVSAGSAPAAAMPSDKVDNFKVGSTAAASHPEAFIPVGADPYAALADAADPKAFGPPMIVGRDAPNPLGNSPVETLLKSTLDPAPFAYSRSAPPLDGFEVHQLLGGSYWPASVRVRADGLQATVEPVGLAEEIPDLSGKGKLPVVEITNTSAVRSPSGQTFFISRDVEPYRNTVGKNDDGHWIFNAPERYISHVSLRDVNGKFVRLLLQSNEDTVYEDPRMSKIVDDQGSEQNILSFTEYLPKEGKIRNRAVVLEDDGSGGFLPPKVGPDGRLVGMLNLSPPEGTEAKNALISRNDKGEIVLRTRLMWHGAPGKYTQQVWIFKNWGEFLKYQSNWEGWSDQLEAGKNGEVLAPKAGLVGPVRARTVFVEESFNNLYDPAAVSPPSERVNIHQSPATHGHGPGAKPISWWVVDGQLYFNEGKNAPTYWGGEAPKDLPIRKGIITFDHELTTTQRQLRLADGSTLDRKTREYWGNGVLWDENHYEPLMVFHGMTQPGAEVTKGGGIQDLAWHMYWMGAVPDSDATPVTEGKIPTGAVPAKIMLSGGGGDANVPVARVSFPDMLRQMFDSKRVATGQVSAPLPVDRLGTSAPLPGGIARFLADSSG